MIATAVKEHPVLFSEQMVRAILSGEKTQTRRALSWRNSTVLWNPAKPYWENLRFNEAETRRRDENYP